MKRRDTRGFTLMEVLIVIAIIAILVAIAIPLFSGTLERTREVTCEANKREILAVYSTEAMLRQSEGDTLDDAALQTLLQEAADQLDVTCPTSKSGYSLSVRNGQPQIACLHHDGVLDTDAPTVVAAQQLLQHVEDIFSDSDLLGELDEEHREANSQRIVQLQNAKVGSKPFTDVLNERFSADVFEENNGGRMLCGVAESRGALGADNAIVAIVFQKKSDKGQYYLCYNGSAYTFTDYGQLKENLGDGDKKGIATTKILDDFIADSATEVTG